MRVGYIDWDVNKGNKHVLTSVLRCYVLSLLSAPSFLVLCENHLRALLVYDNRIIRFSVVICYDKVDEEGGGKVRDSLPIDKRTIVRDVFLTKENRFRCEHSLKITRSVVRVLMMIAITFNEEGENLYAIIEENLSVHFQINN